MKNTLKNNRYHILEDTLIKPVMVYSRFDEYPDLPIITIYML
jgi:hypothetical protein